MPFVECLDPRRFFIPSLSKILAFGGLVPNGVNLATIDHRSLDEDRHQADRIDQQLKLIDENMTPHAQLIGPHSQGRDDYRNRRDFFLSVKEFQVAAEETDRAEQTLGLGLHLLPAASVGQAQTRSDWLQGGFEVGGGGADDADAPPAPEDPPADDTPPSRKVWGLEDDE